MAAGWGLVETIPSGARNGLPVPGGYVYRGAKTLEDELPFVCAGGCGRRLESDRWPACAVCRGTQYFEPAPKCEGCGRKPGSRACRKAHRVSS